jgi:hypothetical protein
MTYVLHNTEAENGQRPRYGVREATTNLLVWADEDAPLATAAALVRFLTDCAGRLSAHEVRAMLAPVSDLPAVPDVEERAS